MLRPKIRPGMKQTDELSGVRIETGDVGAFVPVAVRASEREIVGNGLASMLLRGDVVDLKRQR